MQPVHVRVCVSGLVCMCKTDSPRALRAATVFHPPSLTTTSDLLRQEESRDFETRTYTSPVSSVTNTGKSGEGQDRNRERERERQSENKKNKPTKLKSTHTGRKGWTNKSYAASFPYSVCF